MVLPFSFSVDNPKTYPVTQFVTCRRYGTEKRSSALPIWLSGSGITAAACTPPSPSVAAATVAITAAAFICMREVDRAGADTDPNIAATVF
ncbi:hypothetical protein MCEL_06790 [Mycolicibacterium celeriflavum]|uniref:Uncharacterized protein n=1 Tax=Mycolicibacterium celeriflavum TaxID=1249101 RepID=A0A7I7RCX1_MYCCF|nr:hypothetical protein MCEL_06790 [Mycolicibacterium celeriflavum]